MRVLFTMAFFLLSMVVGAEGNIIEVDLKNHMLTYMGRSYPIAAPRRGAVKPIGEFVIRRKVEWPSWTPTPNMRLRDPSLRAMSGGPRNPLGARALYLYRRSGTSTLFRIHGTNDPSSIGTNASSGCIRMLNDDVIELFAMAPMGTRVVIRE